MCTIYNKRNRKIKIVQKQFQHKINFKNDRNTRYIHSNDISEIQIKKLPIMCGILLSERSSYHIIIKEK